MPVPVAIVANPIIEAGNRTDWNGEAHTLIERRNPVGAITPAGFARKAEATSIDILACIKIIDSPNAIQNFQGSGGSRGVGKAAQAMIVSTAVWHQGTRVRSSITFRGHQVIIGDDNKAASNKIHASRLDLHICLALTIDMARDADHCRGWRGEGFWRVDERGHHHSWIALVNDFFDGIAIPIKETFADPFDWAALA